MNGPLVLFRRIAGQLRRLAQVFLIPPGPLLLVLCWSLQQLSSWNPPGAPAGGGEGDGLVPESLPTLSAASSSHGPGECPGKLDLVASPCLTTMAAPCLAVCPPSWNETTGQGHGLGLHSRFKRKPPGDMNVLISFSSCSLSFPTFLHSVVTQP